MVGYPPICYVWSSCAASSASAGYAGVRFRWCDIDADPVSDACDATILPPTTCYVEYQTVAPTTTTDR